MEIIIMNGIWTTTTTLGKYTWNCFPFSKSSSLYIFLWKILIRNIVFSGSQWRMNRSKMKMSTLNWVKSLHSPSDLLIQRKKWKARKFLERNWSRLMQQTHKVKQKQDKNIFKLSRFCLDLEKQFLFLV